MNFSFLFRLLVNIATKDVQENNIFHILFIFMAWRNVSMLRDRFFHSFFFQIFCFFTLLDKDPTTLYCAVLCFYSNTYLLSEVIVITVLLNSSYISSSV